MESLHWHSQMVDMLTVSLSLIPSGLIVKDFSSMHESAVTVILKDIWKRHKGLQGQTFFHQSNMKCEK